MTEKEVQLLQHYMKENDFGWEPKTVEDFGIVDAWCPNNTETQIIIQLKSGTKFVHSQFGFVRDMLLPKIGKGEDLYSRENFAKLLSARFRIAYREQGADQRLIAKTLGVSQSTISRVLRGDTIPDTHLLFSLCRFLNIDLKDVEDFSDMHY